MLIPEGSQVCSNEHHPNTTTPPGSKTHRYPVTYKCLMPPASTTNGFVSFVVKKIPDKWYLVYPRYSFIEVTISGTGRPERAA